MRLRTEDISRHRFLNTLTRSMTMERWLVLEPHAQLVELAAGDRTTCAYHPARHLYFPTTAIYSIASCASYEEACETSLIGNEGLIGMWALTRQSPEAADSKVLLKGFALKFRAAVIEQEFESSAAFRLSILQYLGGLLRAATQNFHCSRHHTIEQQVAKILLLMSSRVLQSEIHLTHQHIASILGVRREAISLAAHSLASLGLIEQRRGNILICDPTGLEKYACECLEVIRHEYFRVAA